MLRSLLVPVIIVILAGSALAQGGIIRPYWDLAGTECVAKPASGLCYTYIFHEGVPKANASQWVLAVDPGFTATYVAFSTAPYLNILSGGLGYPLDPRGGISIAYGNPTCEPLPALICTITWVCSGTEAQCSRVYVVPDPLATIPSVEVRDCSNQAVFGFGGTAYVNDGTGGCDCLIPVTERTWGEVKALYR